MKKTTSVDSSKLTDDEQVKTNINECWYSLICQLDTDCKECLTKVFIEKNKKELLK